VRRRWRGDPVNHPSEPLQTEVIGMRGVPLQDLDHRRHGKGGLDDPDRQCGGVELCEPRGEGGQPFGADDRQGQQGVAREGKLHPGLKMIVLPQPGIEGDDMSSFRLENHVIRSLELRERQ
jgi:hypothetical protein